METHIILRNITVPVTASEEEIIAIAKAKIKPYGCKVLYAGINKRSVDARKRDQLRFVCSVVLQIDRRLSDAQYKRLDGCEIEPAHLALTIGSIPMEHRPIVVGFGPCGMFASLLLAEQGYKPIVIERGGSIQERNSKTERFFREQILDVNCNIQFGAGGAGTFSDGKCVTRINDPLCRYVLERLTEFGAPKSLLTLAKPHIGTDKLKQIVSQIEARICHLGGDIYYNTRLTDLQEQDDRIVSIQTNRGQFPCSALILAIGHSARDTYELLIRKNFDLRPKDFSVGVRIEHLQEDIDRAMYGFDADIQTIGHAEYTLSKREGERGVYTFCMCPGGQVVAAASEEGGVVVNGMSHFARDGKNANSAIAVSVLRRDYGDNPIKAIEFQRNLERAAYRAGGSSYYAPVQTVGDFLSDRTGTLPHKVQPTYMTGIEVTPCDLGQILPPFVSQMLKTGLRSFDRQIRGFADTYAVLTGIETRTSAPLRIQRTDGTLTAIGFRNLYPGGEGAGYAGGITSAALDGIRVASALMSKYRPIDQ